MQQAGDAAGGAKPKKRWRTWLLRIATALIVMTFLSPTCFTRRLWDTFSEDRRSVAEVGTPELQAFQQGRADGRVTFRLPAEIAARFVDLPTQAGSGPVWLAATPQEYATTVVHLLASFEAMQAASRSIAIDATWEPKGPYLQRVDSSDGKTAAWWFALDYPARQGMGPELGKLSGFRVHYGLYRMVVFRARCSIEVLATPPAEPGTLLPRFGIERWRSMHAEMSQVERMLWTPLSLLADAVTAPIQLLFTL